MDWAEAGKRSLPSSCWHSLPRNAWRWLWYTWWS